MSHRKSRQRIIIFFYICLIACCILLIVLLIKKYQAHIVQVKSKVIIVLSPHYDDAVLSLGGMLAQEEHPEVVATFFTGTPETATTTHWDTISGFSSSTDASTLRSKEDQAALQSRDITLKSYGYLDNQYGRTESDSELESDLAQDIQALIASYHGVPEIDVYGPAYFNATINHPDHILLHEAFLDVARQFPDLSVRFFIYEDYPYVDEFNKTSVISLERNLENESGLLFNQINIPLSSQDVSHKISNLKKYSSQIKAFDALGEDIISGDEQFTSTRCGLNPAQACEVVYEVLRY